MGVATIFYSNEQPPKLTGNETIKELKIYKKMACTAINCFEETKERTWVWPEDKKWFKFLLDCDNRIAYLKRPEPRGEYMQWIA